MLKSAAGVEGKPSSPQRNPIEKLFRRLKPFRFDACSSGSILARGGCSGWGSRTTSVRSKMGKPSSPQPPGDPSEDLFRRLQTFGFSQPNLESFRCPFLCRTHQTFRFSLKGPRASLNPPPHHYLGIDISRTADQTVATKGDSL